MNPSEAVTFVGPSHPDPFQILLAEHAILRHQLDRVMRDPAGSTGRNAAAFVAALRLHMEREETVLYPVCERVFGGRHGATAVMRGDHAAVGATLRSLAQSRNRGDRRAIMVTLGEHLNRHFAREERVLFPLLAARVSNAEAARLVRRMRGAP